MRLSSPLRYPGGKAAMCDLLTSIRASNQLGGHSVAEPFAGGAGASLSLLFLEEAHEIHINDADPAIHDFWWTITRRSGPFIAQLRSTDVSMSEWHRQRNIYRSKAKVSRLRRGFAAFYLNRCNRSGVIINGGPIGGVEQTGKWKLNARFNKAELEVRCARVAEYGDRIHVSQLDAIDFISEKPWNKTFFFVDPPYYGKGETLYLNRLNHTYHVKLSEQLRKMEHEAWILTYDDCPEIREMYHEWARIHPFSLRYAASERRRGREILIAPRWMRLPERQASAAIEWTAI